MDSGNVSDRDGDAVDHWNYRVMRDAVKCSPDDYEDSYRLIEAYYNADGKIVAWAEASPPHGNTLGELFADIKKMTIVVEKAHRAQLATVPDERWRVLEHDELPGVHS
jgi:hypothetical protein